MASLWYRVNQPRVQSSVYTGQWPDLLCVRRRRENANLLKYYIALIYLLLYREKYIS